jgi:hypothetical protein
LLPRSESDDSTNEEGLIGRFAAVAATLREVRKVLIRIAGSKTISSTRSQMVKYSRTIRQLRRF